MLFKKAVSQVVAIMLMMVAAVILGFILIEWFFQFSSDWKTKPVNQNDVGHIDIIGLKYNDSEKSFLGLKENSDYSYNISKVKLNDNDCLILSSSIIESFENVLINCSVVIGNSYNINVFSDKGVFSRTVTVYNES